MKQFFFVLSLLFICAFAPALDDPLPKDFAGAMVYSGKEGVLLALEIPMEVYEGSMRQDLGDIRVFDAAEKPVPFVIRERPKVFFTPGPEEVPFFVWDGGNENNLPSGTDIEINTSGAVVRIKNQNNAPDNSSLFLVDLSFLDYKPVLLKIKTENQGRNFNTPVSIYYSGDLSNWTGFDKKQVLASFGGNVRDTLELPEANDMRYLLVSFESAGGREAIQVASMTALFGEEEREGKFQEVIVRGKKSPDGKKVNYNAQAFYPAETIDFLLTEADSIPVLVKSRLNEKEEWNARFRGTIYRYSTGSGIAKNPPFKIYPPAMPYWELESTGGIPFSSEPDCVLRWGVKELIFPARGKGPWTLAFGNADCIPLGKGEILPLGPREDFETAVFTGVMRFEKAGLPVEAKNNYRTVILWIFLGIAVLGLSVLAYTIARSMKKN